MSNVSSPSARAFGSAARTPARTNHRAQQAGDDPGRGGDHPLIAVTLGFTDYGDYLGLALSRPLQAAGALPVHLPYVEDPGTRAALLDRVDGVVLGFGRDIDPERYGAEPHPSLTAVSPHRDEFEFALTAEALDRELPILGICRGMQVLNVALGGDLHPDHSELPGEASGHPGGDWDRWDLVVEATLGRGQTPEHPLHPIRIAPGSRLAACLGERAFVNSYHHQSVRRLGTGVEPVAWAEDGVVEAIELPGHPTFALAVQWELQECWQGDEASLDVFRAFVAAAAQRRRTAAVTT